ncbi:MAG: FMN-binding protein [Spirochaetaceae bacterium]|nr:FMN-binding protein [Spirochaetaceae bacterium]
MKLDRNSVVYAAVFTFVVCVAFVVILAVANQLTLERVKANRLFEAHFAVVKAFGLADAATPRDQVESAYTSLIKEKVMDKVQAYTAEIDGQQYVGVRLTMPGLWGPITAVLAADPQGTVIRGFEIIDQQETPGLGGRIGEPWFTAQFRGKKVRPDGTIEVAQGSGKGNFDPENGTVDAVTGASRTSDFVKALVNRSLAFVREVGGSL